MSRKRKRKSRPQGVDLVARARRELAKGNAKSALKDAVLCYRKDTSPAHRQLLEEAYVGRVEQLHRYKQSSEARVVLARLLQFNPTTAEALEKIPRLQVILGDSSVDANGMFEENRALWVEQTDRAVLDSREAVPDFCGTKLYVEQVRAALAAIEDGDDGGALGLLRDIPRSSPLCDWKIFIRGLMVFYQSDGTRTQENWRRLDTARPAYRIAQTLLVAAGELHREDAPIEISSPLRRLELHLRNDPAAGMLEEIAEHWREDDQAGFFRVYRRLRQRFAKTHGLLLEKIVDCVWKRSVRENDKDALDRLAHIGPAPALDPNWNRARALLAEHPRQSDSQPVKDYWLAYADDVEGLLALREDERPIAAAMVYARLGERFIEYGEACMRPSPIAEPDVEEAHEFYIDAIDFFEQSIRRCPQWSEAYHGLSMLYEKMKSPEKSAALLQRLVRQNPDDYVARCWLANYYLGQNDPRESEPHVEAVGRLKPRDSQTIALRWNQRIAMVRALAKAKQFEAARQELEKGTQSLPQEIQPYTVDILHAAIELKANRAELAQPYIDAALGTLDEPAAIWMQMSCTAARFELRREIKKDFNDRFKKAIKKKPTSQTAGRLAGHLTPFKVANTNYSGLATHVRLVTDYLKRAKRVRWNEEDLCQVCLFLALDPEQRSLRERLIGTGIKKFSNSVPLHFMAGQLEMERGPAECDINEAERHMNRVLELAAQSAEPLVQKMVETTKRSLGLLHDTKERLASPFSFPFGSPNADEEDDYECDCEDCRSMRAAGESLGDISLGDVDATTLFEEIKQSLPRPLVKQLERAAAKSGTNLEEVLGDIIKEHQ